MPSGCSAASTTEAPTKSASLLRLASFFQTRKASPDSEWTALCTPGGTGMNLLDPREPVSTWSHGVWLLLALWGLVLLWQAGRRDPARKVTMLIYGLCLVFCAASSTLYHGLRLPGEQIHTFAVMDHIS